MFNAAEAHADEGRTTFLEAPMNILIIPAKSKGRVITCLAVSGLALLIFAGCSTHGGSVDSESGGAGQDALGQQPLTGFSKNPAEESVAAGPSSPSKQDGAAAGKKGAGRGVEVSDIYFPFDRWALMEEERKSLTASADFLKGHPKAHLLIEGYCDERGSRDYNLVLGEKRAKETRQFLIDLGVHNAVSIKSYGKERPVCAESAESCYWQNRRTHLMMKAEP
jgi:peptidoglycan-associated lipoprotein